MTDQNKFEQLKIQLKEFLEAKCNLLKNKNILVTGGSGLLGFEIITQLKLLKVNVISLQRHHSVECEELCVPQLLIDLQEANNIQKLEILLKNESIDAVIHTASLVKMFAPYQLFYDANFKATQNLIQACKTARVQYFIYTSTPSVVFERSSLHGVDESQAYTKSRLSYYAYTKMLTEKMVLNENLASFKTLCLRPHLILGPRDKNIVPRLLKASDQNKLRIIGTGENLVDISHVTNMAYAHLLALTNLSKECAHHSPTLSGQAFFLGQGPVKLWEIINEILVIHKRPIITKKIPFKIVYGMAFILEYTYKFFNYLSSQNHEPSMTRFTTLQFSCSHTYNHQKSKDALGDYEIIPTDKIVHYLK